MRAQCWQWRWRQPERHSETSSESTYLFLFSAHNSPTYPQGIIRDLVKCLVDRYGTRRRARGWQEGDAKADWLGHPLTGVSGGALGLDLCESSTRAEKVSSFSAIQRLRSLQGIQKRVSRWPPTRSVAQDRHLARRLSFRRNTMDELSKMEECEEV